MQCVIAFLLLSAKDPDNMDRLVVTQFETNAPSYGVYELTTGRTFPHPALINQPDVIWESEMENGTHIMSYCSESLQSHEIVDKITSGMTDITPRAHLHWNENLEAEMDCYRSLKFVNDPEEKFADNIISDGIIAVDGVYIKYAPPKAEQPIVVTLDKPIELRSLILNGELLEAKKTVSGQAALAWYQGHLHLFKRNRNSDAWMPVTTIGHENYNGWLITNFIEANYPEIIKRWEYYYGNCAKYENVKVRLSRGDERNIHRVYYKDMGADGDYYVDYFFNQLHEYDYYDKKNAKKYGRNLQAALKELIPRKLTSSPASGITMAM
ncbi:putative effector protein [Blumeria hordei DH14]|uniref:Putative effector protein n=1 Tax=Blumeria graminis f. sp. hordei (strain DH14) TaxID=546991 RepID=N1JNZ8_BLUG1|nr:putative effector protein [Blumeria hordei DH14]